MFDPVNEPFFRLDVAGLSHPLIVTAFTGTEAIDELFAFELDVLDEEGELDLAGLMYRACYLALGTGNGGFHAQIQGVNLTLQGLARGHCRLSLGPRLGCLAQRVSRRLFQQCSVPAIIARVLEEHGLGDDAVHFSLKGHYARRAYCVQYEESSLAFVQRLCAEEGIHYHFEHRREVHLLVFADHQGAFRQAPRARFADETGPGVLDLRVTLADSVRRRAGRAPEMAEGESDLFGLTCGAYLPVSGHPHMAWNRLWLVTRLRHRGDSRLGDSMAPGPRLRYGNVFAATSWEVAFRSRRTCSRPLLSGLFRARVVGTDALGAFRDAQGRVAVHIDAFSQGPGSPQAPCWLPLARTLERECQASGSPLAVGTPLWIRFQGADPQVPRIVMRGDAGGPASLPGAPQQPRREPILEALHGAYPLVLLCGRSMGGSERHCVVRECACRDAIPRKGLP
ncbi:contractile injection system protein, VgrG/Pvc8 family [Pseudomonas sp. FEN]|uniref:contractile injection system protein, VgrG/Pvc8 family n=1 Tax=Pseudomonas sp. FEN TaxID=2767468 RepID=UPI00174E78C1|nr:contractile injection system protein, VgrG/Pvc8 family [Pseudomonas sp. FEN]CAD5198782.1 VgrG protein [Pseudomonas sp. FEN]